MNSVRLANLIPSAGIYKAYIDNKLSVFFVLCGFFWGVTYLLLIRRGFLDTTYGMPVVALCANMSWEYIFSFVYPQRKHQFYINCIWLALDLVILYQYLQFGIKSTYYIDHLLTFYLLFIVIFVICYAAIIRITKITNDYKHGKYAAFGINLLMSILFIHMLFSRGSSDGQSIYIAISKMLGTIFSSIAFHVLLPKNSLLNYTYIFIFIFDLLYLIILYEVILLSEINPWTRI
jgi:hypothetical protein